ncbi:hypothetical protein EYE42_09570 [Paracoccus subflavus]|uniref:Peptidase inhibitor I78 n=1 Tax=Paracoccus subflavus TaxID=2528244 RepID=A0A4Q9G2Q9_9RHOB|nr:hypothetical protein [Paracoccus subflavus]TBN39898.1 hypothetical protein EYE42_09570 [Paracoccus subflavus]
MNRSTLFLPLAAMALVAGCMPPAPATMPAPVPAPMPMPAPAPAAAIPAAPEPVLGVAGLTERKPDLCGAAKNHGSTVGQPGSIIPTLGIAKDYRVVEYRGIEPQEYDPNRIVFRLDAAGNISNVDCG